MTLSNALVIAPLSRQSQVREMNYALTGSQHERDNSFHTRLALASAPTIWTHVCANYGPSDKSEALIAHAVSGSVPPGRPSDVGQAKIDWVLAHYTIRTADEDYTTPWDLTAVNVRIGGTGPEGLEAAGFVLMDSI